MIAKSAVMNPVWTVTVRNVCAQLLHGTMAHDDGLRLTANDLVDHVVRHGHSCFVFPLPGASRGASRGSTGMLSAYMVSGRSR